MGYKIITMKRQLLLYLIKLFMGIVIIIICWLALTNIFRDASFYILDEPNAALDTVSEREVFEKFFELSKDKIGVFISHRLNAAKMADKIIVMDKGKIVGIGKHDELLRNCMTYQKPARLL